MGIFSKAKNKVIEDINKRVERGESEDTTNSVSELLDTGMKETFRVLSGSTTKKKLRIPDNIVAFIGAAGGVGTSTIVANTALQLVRGGYSVLVMDCNLEYPVQHSYLGYRQTDIKKDLCSFLYGECTMGEAIQNKKEVHLLCARNRTLMDFINLDNADRAKELEVAIQRLRDLYDVILLDVPNQLASELINIVMYKADKIHIVWDENIACIGNTERLKTNLTISGIETENKMDVIFNQRSSIPYTKYPLDKLELEVIATLPFDSSVRECALRGGIYLRDGFTSNRNAKVFTDNIKAIAYKVLVQGGHIDA